MATKMHVDDSNNNFKSLGLSTWLIDQCKAIGISKPTPIQKNCIPEILKGNDCLASAKTGSGKTAAFALPILQLLSEDPYGIFALVITPTRELAFQIGEQFQVLGKPINLRVTVITGGLNMTLQGINLTDQPHIVISTPGRLADHLESCKTFNFNRLRFLVLDEADRLLEDNFGEQLETIFNELPEKRQTLLFSATFTKSLEGVIEASKKKPFVWHAESSVATVEQLDQRYVLTAADMKDAYMLHIVDVYVEQNPSSSIMIFTSTCKYCQIIGMVLNDMGFDCVVLHSMMTQQNRLAALAKFKSSQVRILIATDVASRGLDIPMVDLIINHNIPNNPKNYVHRVGRTARAGRGGKAITFVTQFDIKLVQAVEAFINTKLKLFEVEEKEVTKILVEVMLAKSEAEIVLDERDFGEYKKIHKRKRAILEGRDPDEKEKERRKRKLLDRAQSRAREALSKKTDENPGVDISSTSSPSSPSTTAAAHTSRPIKSSTKPKTAKMEKKKKKGSLKKKS